MKKIILLILGLAVIVVLLIIGAKQIKNRNQGPEIEHKNEQQYANNQQDQQTATTTQTDSTSTSTVEKIEASDLDDRQNRIDNVFATKGKDYQRYSLLKDGPKNLIITHYLYQLNFKESSKDRRISRDRRGILVFEEKRPGEIELIWESMDEFTDPRIKTGVHDLTSDGVNEIIALLDNDQGGAVLIYKWNGKSFDMITPYYEHIRPDGKVSLSIAFGADSSMTKIFDVDKDGVPEVVFPFNIRLDYNNDTSKFNYRQVYRAYKWNGKEYYLLKEQEQSFTPSTRRDEYSVINVLYPPTIRTR